MRTFIRNKVDLDKPVKLEELKPLTRIATSIRYRYLNSKLYLGVKDKEENQKLLERTQKIEEVKNIILSRIDKTLNRKDNYCLRVDIAINRGFEDVIDDVLYSVDFIAYTIDRKEEDEDFLRSFPETPILISVRKKVK